MEEPIVLFKSPALAHYVHFERCQFRFIVEPVLLHGHLCVAQEVLFLGQLCLGVEYLQVEVTVAESHDNIPFADSLTFLGYLLANNAAFLRRYLHDLDRHHCSIEPHVIFELAFHHSADGDVSRLYHQCASAASYSQPQQAGYYNDSADQVRKVLFLQASFLFNYSIHKGTPL